MAKVVYNELPISSNGYPEKLLKIQTDFMKEFPDPGFGTGKVGSVKVGSGKSEKHYKYTKGAREERKKALNALKRAREAMTAFAEKAKLLISAS